MDVLSNANCSGYSSPSRRKGDDGHAGMVEIPLRRAFEQLEKQLKGYLKPGRRFDYRHCLSVILPQLKRIYLLYDFYADAWKEGLRTGVACRRGCPACCGHYVTSVEPFELLYLDWQIKNRPDYSILLVEMLRRQRIFEKIARKEKPFNEDKALFRYYLKKLPCPFLASRGTCGIYDIRPIPCRMFFSLSRPLWCRGENAAAPDNRNILLELPEDIEATIFRVSLLFEPLQLPVFLFPGLLRANELFGRYSLPPE